MRTSAWMSGSALALFASYTVRLGSRGSGSLVSWPRGASSCLAGGAGGSLPRIGSGGTPVGGVTGRPGSGGAPAPVGGAGAVEGPGRAGGDGTGAGAPGSRGPAMGGRGLGSVVGGGRYAPPAACAMGPPPALLSSLGSMIAPGGQTGPRSLLIGVHPHTGLTGSVPAPRAPKPLRLSVGGKGRGAYGSSMDIPLRGAGKHRQ